MGRPPQEPQPSKDGAETKPASLEDLHARGMHGFHIDVMQDPIRIAPGESGNLVLVVEVDHPRLVGEGLDAAGRVPRDVEGQGLHPHREHRQVGSLSQH